jgi:iron complex outermembrane recepter protein
MCLFVRRIRCCSSAVTIVLALALASTAANASPKPFSIDSEEAPRALVEFGRQSTLQILFATEKVKGIVTNAVHGNYEPIDALRLLLKGTPLVVSEKADGVLVVQPQAKARNPVNADPVSINNDGNSTQFTQPGSNLASNTGTPNRDSSSVSPGSDNSSLSEITVTAQKRVERLIDTPQSVSVVSSDDLARLGAVQFSDFASTVPGLNFFTAGAGYTQISLRGVTAGFDTGPTVAVYVDEVPYGSSSDFANGAQTALDVGLFDLDRVEVLRGPQGTLYGASSLGGLIKYVTKQPDTNAFSGDVQTGVSGTAGGGTNYNVSSAVNMPVIPGEVAVRISGFESHDGGYIDNVALDQKDVNRSDIYGGRVNVLITPNDSLTIRVGGFLQDISRDGESTVNYTFAGVPAYGSLDQYHPFAEPFEQQFRLVSGTVAYDFGPTTLTSISSYQSNHTQVFYDETAAYAPFLATDGLGNYSAVGDPLDLTTDKFTEEVRLASNGSQKMQWIVGGFYTHESSGNTQSFVARNLAGQYGTYDLFFDAEPSTYKEMAGFGDLTYHLTDAFDVSGGLRYSRNDQTFSVVESGVFGASNRVSSSSQSDITYLANARYHFNQNTTGYVRYATGYHPGGPNFGGINPATGLPFGSATFQSEKLSSYEAGIKLETGDRRFGADLDGYRINWTNIQVAGDGGIIVNAPGANIWGSELTLTARPIDQLTATGAFAYTDARMSQADADLGATQGERLPNVPDFTASLNADYKIAQGGLIPTVGATVRYISDRTASYNGDESTLQYRLPAYTQVDLRSGLKMSSVGLQLYAHNLFNERGQLSAITYRGPQAWVALIQPRTVGITAMVHF